MHAQVTFGYDTVDRLTSVTRVAVVGGPSVSTALGYDNANRLTSIADTSSTAGSLESFTYGYDNANRVTSYTGPERAGHTPATGKNETALAAGGGGAIGAPLR